MRHWLRLGLKPGQRKKKLLEPDFQQILSQLDWGSGFACAVFPRRFQVVSRSKLSFSSFLDLLLGCQPWG